MAHYQPPVYSYVKHADQSAATPAHHAVIVVGAGPVGLCAAIDLAQQGVDVVLVDDNDTVSDGSRAICFAKRTLEIFDRLGVGDRMMAKGITWNIGRVFFGERELYAFDLLPEPGHKRPAFINLQQYFAEAYLVDYARDHAKVDARWKNRLTAIDEHADAVLVTLDTPDGAYRMSCDWLIAADGANSTVRRLKELDAAGQTFRDKFLIADVRMRGDFPTERWFWFDPPFHRGQSVLLHRQADDVWRIDFQLGWDADAEQEKQPERVAARIRAMLGPDRAFELEWVSVYTFRCARLPQFVYDRVIFVGDSAHQVSPFGARGANSGVQDVDNLVWKLARITRGEAPRALLDSYSSERVPATDENILNSTRSTDFITPKSRMSRMLRDATLDLAARYPFARRLVNSGRLSVPAVLDDSPLNTADEMPFAGPMRVGAPALDAPLEVEGQAAWLIDQLGGRFDLVLYVGDQPPPPQLDQVFDVIGIRRALVVADGAQRVHVRAPARVVADQSGWFAKRYDAAPGSTYLFRPDQHLAARWRALDVQKIGRAISRSLMR